MGECHRKGVKSGITSGYLSHLMNGRRSPSSQVRQRLQQVLGGDDFHRLFIIVPVDDDGGGAERADVP